VPIEPESTDILTKFVDSLEGTMSLSAMEALFSATLTNIGIKYFTYHIAHIPGSSGRLPYILSTYPESWVKHYFEKKYLDHDPVVDAVDQRRLPFVWSEVTDSDDLNRRQRVLMDEARQAGVSDGMTIPFVDGAVDAALHFVAEATTDGRAGLSENRHLLHLLALYFHRKAKPALLEASLLGQTTRRASLLTPREKEVLEWTARGKSTWEIAAILNISDKSIEFHIEGAKRKLQVFNRTHAVVKAVMLGLISL
jgi:DNA-binding CsgD family transcriptional regulator